jgi:antitoxin component YwqK of YwqJK toxin-antitoxin module
MNEYNEQGQKHGPWKGYWSNGKLCYKANYLNDVLHGPWEGYGANGKLRFKVNHINGKQHGLWEYYYSNGELDEIKYLIR